MKHRLILLVGVVVSAVSLWWVFSGVNLGELLYALEGVHWIALIPSLFFFYLSMYLRAVRWAIFFRPRRDLSGARLFRPVMIGFAVNCILPAHAGEAVRALYVGRHEQTGTATALATIMAERLFDVLTLVLCLGAALLFLPPIEPSLEVSIWGITVRGSMIDENLPKLIWGTVFLFVAVSLMLTPGFLAALARHLVRPGLPQRAGVFLERVLGDIERGLAPLKDASNLMEIVVHSIMIWLGVALSMWTLAFGFPDLRLDFWQTLATMSLLAVFVMVPSAPGYWGLFEAAIVFMLLAMGAVDDDKAVATAYAITAHLVQYVPLVVVGLALAMKNSWGGPSAHS